MNDDRRHAMQMTPCRGRWLACALAASVASTPAAGIATQPVDPASLSAEQSVALPAALNVKQAVRLGLDRHPQILAAGHDVLTAEAIAKQIESVQYPQITGIWSNSGGNTRVLANLNISGSLPKPVNYLTTPGVRVDQLITDFGHTAHLVLAQRRETAAAEKAVLTAQALVILDVQHAYLSGLKQRRLVDIAREALKVRQVVRDQAESLYRHKLRSKLDLEFAEVEMDRANLALIRAENELKIAFARLTQAMGGRGPVEYALEEVSFQLRPRELLERLLDVALAKRPELLGARDRAQAAEEAVKAAKALRFGQITAIGTLGYTWWRREEVSSDGNVTNPGAQLGWWGAGGTSAFPIYTGGRIQGQVEEAQAHKGEADADTRSISNDIALQVVQAYVSRQTAEQQIGVAETRVAQAAEALTLAQERYKANLGSILDVTTASANLLDAQVGLADARYSYLTSDAALAYATGQGLAEQEAPCEAPSCR